MGLPGKASGGGGYLNNVAGTIAGYNFDAKEWPGKKGADPYTTFSLELEILADGATDPVSQFLKCGFLNDGENISDDGQRMESENPVIAVGSDAHRFLTSLVDAGFPEAELVATNLNDLTPIVNARVTFKREVDEEAVKRGQKDRYKNKEGKEVESDPKILLVKEYHGQVERTGKAGKKAAATKGAKTTASKKPAAAEQDFTQAENVLLSILADADENTLSRTALSGKIVRYAVDNKLDNDTREGLRKLIGSEDFLAREAGWSFDAAAKGQPVALA